MECGLIDADLGGDVVKKIAFAGRGKRGSSRILIATNKNDRWFFVYGFEKNERENINSSELKALQALANDLLNFSATELKSEIKNNTLQEICYDNEA